MKKFMKKRCRHLLAFLFTILMLISSASVGKAASPDQTLLNTYATKYGRVGAAVSLSQLQNSSTLNIIKQRYNSITLENEMKPDALLGYSPNLISVSTAQSLGYYIPSNYTEAYVPRINFSTLDQVLQICYNNGLGMRAHTLVWHAQTPSWFFRTNYSSSGGFVSQQVMTARLEFYIKTVMNHVYLSPYGSVVYAWDVVNEYLHSPSDSGWVRIFGNVSTRAQFVRDAFRFAHETLSYFGLRNTVKLFYNDYNEYMIPNDIIALINFINSGTKYCDGVGGQSHISTSFPSASYYKSAYQAFMNAGLEIQITELDAGAPSESAQASYVYDIMKAINELKKAGANITSITWWGLSDDVSWRDDNPLLFSNLYTPKASYYRTIDAYNDVFGAGGPTTSLTDGWYYIRNVHSGKYLTVANNTGANAQNVEIRSMNGTDGQKWYLTNLGNGYFTLRSRLGNYALDVVYGENTDGANIQIYSYYGGTAQQFKAVPGNTSGQFGIVTACSNDSKGLDCYNWTTYDGTNVCQWTYYAQANQLWIFEPTN